MSDDEPHAVTDDTPQGSAAKSTTTVVVSKRSRQKITVEIQFDDNLKEFQLWDYLYDIDSDHFELDAIPDYENRTQYYEIGANRKAIRKLRLWLIKNKFKYKVDRYL